MIELSAVPDGGNSRGLAGSLRKDELGKYNKMVFEKLLEAENKGKNCVLYTLLEAPNGCGLLPGAHLLALSAGCAYGTLGATVLDDQIAARAGDILDEQGAAAEIINVNLSAEEDNVVKILEEPFSSRKKLLIFGAGHISLPLAEMASLLGYDTIIVDDRQELVSRERFPHAGRLICAPFEDVFDEQFLSLIDAATSIVIVTRGHAYDRLCLGKVIASEACFIGMIGSRSKVQTNFRSLLDMGISKEQLSRVAAPIGLDLKGQRPEEIALSIFAEMVAEEHGGSGERLSDKFKEEAHFFDQ